jgi:hypothetical protein
MDLGASPSNLSQIAEKRSLKPFSQKLRTNSFTVLSIGRGSCHQLNVPLPAPAISFSLQSPYGVVEEIPCGSKVI